MPDLAELGQQLRVDSVRAAAAAGSGHPTSSMSAADLMAVLLAKHHWPQGGLGDAVLNAFTDTDATPRVTKLAVTALPGSATPAEQLQHAGIDSTTIAGAART